MSVQVSRCYYHPDTPAVATCAKCGAGLCKDCVAKDDSGRILCHECGQKQLDKKHDEFLRQLKKDGGRFKKATDFIIPGIIGILLAVAVWRFETASGAGLYFYAEFGPAAAYLLFAAPFGYIQVKDFSGPTFGAGKIIPFIFDAFFALLLGWIIFPFILLRFIIRKIKSRNNKAQ